MTLVQKIDPALETRMATALRILAMDAVEAAQSGHPGMPMGMADVATVLFNRFIRIDPACPDWPDRDRFVLSAGHGSMLQYAIHHLLGYADMPIEEIRRFRQLGARTAGHPEYGHAAGIETTTGPLGQGIATAVGMALAERMLAARFGSALVDHYTYVLAGDGCLMEGISHEAADLAGHLGLGRLVVLWDDNRITIDGPVSLSSSADQGARFAALGWHVLTVDGHDPEAIAAAIDTARADPRPSLIACRTQIGRGAPTKAGTSAIHGAPLGAAEIAAAREALGWSAPPFEIPPEIRAGWQAVARRGAEARADWALRKSGALQAEAFDAMQAAPDPDRVHAVIRALKARVSAEEPVIATRKSSERVLAALNAALPQTVGGSADLTGSNNTITEGMYPVSRTDFSGRYIHYGIREHGMAAAMNGMALHGGLRPYGGTFLAFADYARPAIRLGALMGVPVVHVMTHDSIGLGEDGPTHQPVEQLASLRAIPNLVTFRPADTVETAEAWEWAITATDMPSVLCLSRQALPTLRRSHEGANLSARGAYVLREAIGPRDVTLIATGSEVALAVEAADLLEATGIRAAVVSAPCFELFATRPEAERAEVLGRAPRLGIEAAIRQGWDGLLREGDGFLGLSGFGASAPAPDLYRHFGLTPERAAVMARALTGA